MEKPYYAAMAIGVLASGLMSGSASAAEVAISANQCTVESGDVTFTAFGAQNNSTAAPAVIWCAITLPQPTAVAPYINWANVYTYDRNSSGTGNVGCTIYAMDLDGTGLSSQGKTTSGSSSFAKILSFSGRGGEVVSFHCSIPPKTASGLSHVTSIQVNYNY